MFLAILVLGLMIQYRSGRFFDANNLVDFLRAFIVPCTFAIGTYIVIVSGGIDISFPGLSALVSYVVVLLQLRAGPENASLLAGYVLCFLLGALLGSINGFLIGYYKLPSLIVTLGTVNLYWGILFGPLNNLTYPLPRPLMNWSRVFLFTVTNPSSGISASLPALFIIAFTLIPITWFIMYKTMIGRGIYAIGGNIDAASRVGFNVLALQVFVYAFSGGLAGLCGYNRIILTRILNPAIKAGTEMTIIAGVVLGGVRITGGVGTLSGALLGTIFLTILNNSLMLLGFSPYWADAATGVAIVIGISISTIQIIIERRKQIRHTNISVKTGER